MPGLLDVAVAAQTLQRLGGHRRAPLGHPVLGGRHREPQERPLRLASRRRTRRPAAAPASSPPPTPAPDRPARCASAACRSARRRTRCGTWQWWTACATACRISAAEPSTQSSRVAATISMMVRTPRPSSPTRRAQVPSNSTSLDALDRLPSLSLSRWIANTLRVPSGSTRGSRKHVSPPGACASTRKPSDIGAEQNHLCPVSTYSPSLGERLAPASCWPVRRCRPASPSCPSRRARRPSARRAAAPASYTVRGQPRLPLGGQRRVGAQRGHRRVRHRQRAAVPGLGLRPHQEPGGAPHMPAGPRPRRRSARPRRRVPEQPVPGRMELDLVDAVPVAVVGAQLRRVLVRQRAPLLDLRGTGGAAERRRARRVPRSSSAGARCRSTASVRARSAAKTSYPTRGGTWLVTVWVVAAMPIR